MTTKLEELVHEVEDREGYICGGRIGDNYTNTSIYDIVKATMESLLEIAKP